MEYAPDIFYSIERLSFEKRMELIKEALPLAETVFIDRIEGMQRQNVPGANPDHWLKTYPKHDSIFRFIHRRGYDDVYRLQIVVNEFIDFIWINLNEEHIPYFLEKYKLVKIS